MTLVLNLATTNWVFQVSDRRLTFFDPSTGRVMRRDDDRNKAVLLGHSIAFAFTGLAELGSDRRTDIWLARALSAFDASTALSRTSVDYIRAISQALADAANTELAKPRWRSLPAIHRRMSFAAAGWACDDDGAFRPYIARLSNFEDGRDAFGEARAQWTLQGRLLTPDLGGNLVSIGVPLSTAEEADLIETLRDADYGGASPDHMVFILGEAVRSIAARVPDELVGRGLLITSIPRAAAEQATASAMVIASGPNDKVPTFLYVAPDDSTGVAYGPTFVSGGTVLSDFTARSLKPGDKPFGAT